ncbi:DUF6328 family protein [Pseudonocardia ailaonensis]|uniref:DUF6328 family protein n=1 Tax=Pseudonocardia ailaonensis TaxID=367279 RepID=A0ABN2MJ02_9PSEU
MEPDADWNSEARPGETETERLDRNWADLLQELRVAQTGVQLLTGLLLTVPFQSRFTDLVAHQRTLYLVTACLSVLATGLLIAPVLLHRMLFRLHARRELVVAAQRFAVAGLGSLALAVLGVLGLIFDVVLGGWAGYAAAGAGLLVLVVLWLLVPLGIRRGLSKGA